MGEKQKEMRLKVAEAIQDDVNKGIVRIDSSYMRQIDIHPGNIVEIVGERSTVGIADRALPGDIGLNIIRMDPLIRRNSKSTIGELVTVKKAEVEEAKKTFSKYKWPTIDVTRKSVEETAASIIKIHEIYKGNVK